MITPQDVITISDAAKLWLSRCELEQLERATLHSYRSHVNHHIEPKIGYLLLKELSAVHVAISSMACCATAPARWQKSA